eukprot:c15568_g1_i1.p1 GENE.c15568_g1_i1~~c15568_g1_i1.p1  ORF type:complete len:136 (+),score=11.73 c15568_g1_i1:256-663(+)
MGALATRATSHKTNVATQTCHSPTNQSVSPTTRYRKAIFSSERTSTSLHSCQTCDPATSCCESFPYCVACCMSEPQRLSLANSVPDRVVHLYASLHSVFDVCQIVCRTNSRSVVFETTFKQPKTRHCYQYPNSVK